MTPHRFPPLAAWLLSSATCLAATAASAAAPVTTAPDPGPVTAPGATAEPNVQRIVNEDQGSKIEELKVRGNTTRISVTPKVGNLRGYEIITEDGSRDVSDGLTGSRGAAGKRVWRVLSF
jgi:hypothetical protein